MTTRRIFLLAAALAVALFGTAIVFVYSASRGPQARATEPETQVLVASSLIPGGTTGAQAVERKLVAVKKIPSRLVPLGALTDVVAIREHEAAGDIQPGEILLPSRFVSTTLAGTLDIPDDKVAVSISVADPQRVAGFVRPGLDVAVFDTYEVKEPDDRNAELNDEDQDAGSAAVPLVKEATRLLLPRATVIAVGPTAAKVIGTARADGDPAEGTQGVQDERGLHALVTLAVTIEQAQKLAHAAHTGKITLGLLSKESRTGTRAADDNRTIFE